MGLKLAAITELNRRATDLELPPLRVGRQAKLATGRAWCAILNNLTRVEAPNDPLLDELDVEIQTRVNQKGDDYNEEEERQPHALGDYHNKMEETQHSNRITIIQITKEWTRFRDNLAEAMFLHYQNRLRL
ncbi:hypothetical protein AAHA92_29306 [Salvia divinorum]|uniref:Uncharacterized protein n=1 Tax=Salvia divinorum TaxID=28513 RepID=A0ABD1FXY5_SALDI